MLPNRMSVAAVGQLLAQGIMSQSDAEKLVKSTTTLTNLDLYSGFAFFTEFLNVDDPNLTPDQVVDKILARGVRYSASSSGQSPVGSLTIPMRSIRSSDGILSRVVPSVDISEYKEALSTIKQDFTSKYINNGNFNGKTVHLKVAATQGEFEEMYKSVSNTNRDLNTVQGVNFALRSDGKEVTLSDARVESSSRYDSSLIIINHEVASTTGPTFAFGSSSVAETVMHEYGHSLHRSISRLWGNDKGGELDKDYADLFAQEVSSYGSNNYQEHFAESFAKMLYGRQEVPGFNEFLEKKLKLKKLDPSAFPEILQGNNLIDGFVNFVNNQPSMAGFKFVVTDQVNPLKNLSSTRMNDLLSRIAQGTAGALTFSVMGHFVDDNGRTIKNSSGGTVHRTFTWNNGDLTVYHNYFKLPTSVQGNGLGNAFIDSSFDYYKSIGLRRVDVYAALDNGPYMWALKGFDFDPRYGDGDKTRALSNARNYYKVLKTYQENQDSYGSMDRGDVIRDILEEVNRTVTSYEIDEILEKMERNGWAITNTLIEQLKDIIEANPNDVSAQMIANIGRGNKKSDNKKYSTIGRVIMMALGSWHGYKDM